MFEKLTAFLPQLQEARFGTWDFDRENDGTPEHPLRMPHVIYKPVVWRLEEEMLRFVDGHESMRLRSYDRILEDAGLKWGLESMKGADVSKLDGQTVMALIVGAFRAERFCDGTLLEFLEEGCMERWLRRLQEIDGETAR